MKKIGIIGGLGPESTVDYYRGIVETFRKGQGGLAGPEMVIYSADVDELFEMVEAAKWDSLIDWLLERIRALQRAGAQFAAIGANTPHIVFDEVQARSPIPLLSIVEETCRKAENLGIERLGLMGTRATMQADFYQKRFESGGMSLVVPMADEIEHINNRLFSEIELGIIKDSTRKELLSIVKRMLDEDSIQGLILGCTELPRILDKEEYGIPFLNTTAIHIEGIVRYCIGT
ncbi:MAG: amino acid racemase [Syntrophales bacterium]|nr:amino acid racemase [Syntrophales bacterium]